jgi:hypothetical protein
MPKIPYRVSFIMPKNFEDTYFDSFAYHLNKTFENAHKDITDAVNYIRLADQLVVYKFSIDVTLELRDAEKKQIFLNRTYDLEGDLT